MLRAARALFQAIALGLIALAWPVAPAAAADTKVEMLGHSFIPDHINVVVGDTVTWVNVEDHDDLHTVTSQGGGPLDSGTIGRGETFSFTFTAPGNYPYLCTVHDGMFGIVRVREPGVPFAADDALALTKGDAGAASGSLDVLANDEDLEGDPLSVTAFDQVSAKGGAVSCSAQGTCTYTQAPSGTCPTTDSFRYTISDGARTDRATVNVTIECARPPPPVDTSVGLRLRRHLVATGSVASSVAACEQGRRVKIQRRGDSGSWTTVVTVTTASNGGFEARLKDRPGRYRAKVGESTLASGQVCGASISAVDRHRH
jgi:plastocyanin